MPVPEELARLELCVCVHIYIYIHTYIHTHTHTMFQCIAYRRRHMTCNQQVQGIACRLRALPPAEEALKALTEKQVSQVWSEIHVYASVLVCLSVCLSVWL
jgi:hypothetical protein